MFVGGDLSANGRTYLIGDLSANGNANIGSNVNIDNNLFIGGDLSANGKMFLAGDLSANATANIGGNVKLIKNIFIGGDLSANGKMFLAGDLSANATANIGNNVNIKNNAFVGGDLSANGRTYLIGDLSANGNANIGNNLNIKNNAFVGGDLSANGNANIGGNVNIKKSVFIGGDLSANGNTSLNGNKLYTQNSASVNNYIQQNNSIVYGGTARSTLSISDNTAVTLLISGTLITYANIDGINVQNRALYLKTAESVNYIRYISDNSGIGIIGRNGGVLGYNTTGLNASTSLGVPSSLEKISMSWNNSSDCQFYGNIFAGGLQTSGVIRKIQSYDELQMVTVHFKIYCSGKIYYFNDSGLNFPTNTAAALILNGGTIYTQSTSLANNYIVRDSNGLSLSDSTAINLYTNGTEYFINQYGLNIPEEASIVMHSSVLYTTVFGSSNNLIFRDNANTELRISDTNAIRLRVNNVDYAFNPNGMYLPSSNKMILNGSTIYTNLDNDATNAIVHNSSGLSISDSVNIKLINNATTMATLDNNGFTMNNGYFLLNQKYLYTNSAASTNSHIKHSGTALTVSDTTQINWNINGTTIGNVTSAGMNVNSGYLNLNAYKLYTSLSSSANSYIAYENASLTISDPRSITFKASSAPVNIPSTIATIDYSGITLNSGYFNLLGNILYPNLQRSVQSYIGIEGNAFVISDSAQIKLNIAGNTICTVNPSNTAAGNYEFNVNGEVQATAYNATSDRRLKDNIQPMESQWENIKRVIPSAYTWKSNGVPECGFVAQQLHEVFPTIRRDYSKIMDPTSSLDEPVDVSGNPIYYSVDYGKMTPYLWKGMQELIQVVERQNEIIATQSLEIADLKSNLEKINRILGIQ